MEVRTASSGNEARPRRQLVEPVSASCYVVAEEFMYPGYQLPERTFKFANGQDLQPLVWLDRLTTQGISYLKLSKGTHAHHYKLNLSFLGYS